MKPYMPSGKITVASQADKTTFQRMTKSTQMDLRLWTLESQVKGVVLKEMKRVRADKLQRTQKKTLS